jgi:hypothetical protein
MHAHTQVVEKKSKKAKLREEDLNLYCLEQYTPLHQGQLGPAVVQLFAARPDSQAEERVLTHLAEKVGGRVG